MQQTSFTVGWLSGRKRTPAKGVRVDSPSRVRIPHPLPFFARVVELVDTTGLGPVAARCGGSSPSPGTT